MTVNLVWWSINKILNINLKFFEGGKKTVMKYDEMIAMLKQNMIKGYLLFIFNNCELQYSKITKLSKRNYTFKRLRKLKV